jgi:hypothetical protein
MISRHKISGAQAKGLFLVQAKCYNIKVEVKMESKKYLIILILKILETNTDKDHPKTQTQIAKEISDVYHCDRKTVGRNIAFLIKVGYPIVKTTKGYYLDTKTFTVDETRFIMESIYKNPEKSKIEKEVIARKISRFIYKINRKT